MTGDAIELREKLTAALVRDGWITSPAVEQAFRVVERERFAPGVSLDDVYDAERVLLRLTDDQGVTVSSVSAPTIQAMMLEQADLSPGQRVLEIGSGGANAALIAQIVGDEGAVTSIDIDPRVVERARTCLAGCGCRQVEVLLADGEQGWAPGAPYDRIIVTVGSWDMPAAWEQQLAPEGVIVVPLRMRGLTRSVAFERVLGQPQRLRSRSARHCGFVPMRGQGAHTAADILFRGGEIMVRFDDDRPSEFLLAPDLFDGVRAEVSTEVGVGRAVPFPDLHLWLATVLDGFCLLGLDPDRSTGVVVPQYWRACPAFVEGDSIAYLTLSRSGRNVFAFGAHGFGPRAQALAEQMTRQVEAWDVHYRHGPRPVIEVTPGPRTTTNAPEMVRVIPKIHTSVSIEWSETPLHESQHPTESSR